ncbi:MAG TPA: NHL repeat-containing protein [Bryobacteraceae bacterium]|nr:NHL repeat-containing protein [Bryobacteraceae bacterium]
MGPVRRISAFYLVSLTIGFAGAQTITTVAGGGPLDGAPALTAAIGSSFSGNSVAADNAGNLYIAAAALNRVFKVAPDGTIATVAGNGSASFSGDGGPAAQAGLSAPTQVALDGAGNLYIADFNSLRIRRVSNGIITTVAGNGTCCSTAGDGGPATSASLFNTAAMTVDAAGRIYIFGGNELRMVSGGIITTILIAPDAGGLAVDAAGNVYVADGSRNQIYKILVGSTLQIVEGVTIAGTGKSGYSGDGGAAISASLAAPSGVAVAADGAIFIADYGNNRIRKVVNGIISTVAGNGTYADSGDGGPAASAALLDPVALALDGSGALYIGTQASRVRKISSGIITTVAGNGSATIGGEGGPATSAQLGAPSGVAVNSAGDLFFSDGSKVYKVSRGIITTVAGNGTPGYSGDGGPAASAQLNGPVGVAADSAGNVFIADSGNNRVRQVSGGVITTVAGNGVLAHAGDGGPAVNAELWDPTGVAVDNAGNLYIADYGNHRIRKVSGGIITNFAGNGGFGPGGDGGPAVNAQLAFPHGVAVDTAGNVYIADTNNARIRKVSNGIITTVVGIGDATCWDIGPCPTGSNSIYPPWSVAVDPSGNVFFDSGYGWVQEVSAGVLSTFAGSGQFTTGFAGDGGPALSALLNYPLGVAADGAGNVYIADSKNGRIRKVAARATVTADSVTPVAGGGSQAITFRFSDPKGWQDLDVVNVLINNILDARNACYLAYSRASNTLYLVNDAGSNVPAGLVLNGSGALTNSQCTVNGVGSSATGAGNTLALTLNLSFSAAFAGNKVVWLAARDSAQGNSGWQPLGTWTTAGVQGTISAAGVSPSGGTGPGGTFVFTFADTKGVPDIGVVGVLINDALDGRNACYLLYSAPSNTLYIVDYHLGSYEVASLALNGPGALESPQCTVTSAGSSAAASGTTLTLKLSVSFDPTFAGNKTIYLDASDAAGIASSGWQALGSWTAQ